MTDVGREPVAGRVLRLELRRPPHNFFDEALLAELADALSEADDDPAVGAVVLSARGRNFCAGADLRGVDAAGIRAVYRQGLRLFTGRTPVVAALHGATIGGGLGLALAADFRIAAPGARLAANFARLGFHHGFGLTVTLPRAVGEQRAAELLYTGRSVSGAEAAAIGLCDDTADDPVAAATRLAEEIAASAPLAVTAIRATLRATLAERVAAALDREAAAQAALLGTADFAEGIAASIAKRAPRFTGA